MVPEICWSFCADNSSLHASEQQDDLDFIDTGSIAELANSDTEFPGIGMPIKNKQTNGIKFSL